MQAGFESLDELMADEKLAGLSEEARPAFFFRLDEPRLAWANPAAGRRLGRATLLEVLTLGLAAEGPLRQDVRSLARTAGEKGSLGRLRLRRGFGAVPEMCECRKVTVAGRRGLLAIATKPERAPSAEEASTFYGIAAPAAAETAGSKAPPPAATLPEASSDASEIEVTPAALSVDLPANDDGDESGPARQEGAEGFLPSGEPHEPGADGEGPQESGESLPEDAESREAAPQSEEETAPAADLTEAVRRALPAWIADRLTTYEPEKDPGRHAHSSPDGGEKDVPAEDSEPASAGAPEEKTSLEEAEGEGLADAEEAAGEWAAPVVPLNAGQDDAGTGVQEPHREEDGSGSQEVREPVSGTGEEMEAPAGEEPVGPEAAEDEAAEDLSAEEETAEGEAPETPAAAEEPAPDEALRPAAAHVPEAALPPAPRDENGRAAGRSQPLPPVSVRFLWQTDAAHRVLFVSQGLTQLVGRHAEIVGEKWQDASERLRLDPTGRINKAFAARDTWSGLTAWWPSLDGDTRIPAELTALPVFDADRTFQGFRGFGVLRPAEALKAEAFDLRFPPAEENAMPGEPPEKSETEDNVVPFRADLERLPEFSRLSQQEKRAFETIASALGARISDFTPSTGTPREERPAPSDREETRPSPEDEAASEIDRMLPDRPDEEEAPPAPQEPATQAPPPDARPAMPAAPVLAAKVNELQAIVDTALDGVVVLDGEGFIESVNRSAEALLGIEEEDVVGEAFTVLLEEESHETAEAYLESIRAAGIRSLINEGREVLGRTPGGPLALFMTFGQVGTPERPRFCAVLRDITQWKETEARLREARAEAEKASTQKSDFLARVSHEIRTPLNAIIGFAEVMVEERFGPIENQRYREYLRDIRSSSEHVVSLVNDLLDISRVEAGKLDLDFVAVDVNAVARECVGLMQPQASSQKVIIRTSFSPELPPVVADERTMKQIFLNLLSNSVKYTGAGGQVIVSTRLEETGELVLRVRDNGGGMSEADLAKAMEPFRQVISSAVGSGTGSGLGLPLTKALVEANRAEFTLRSARGEGTIAEIAFPPTRVLSE